MAVMATWMRIEDPETAEIALHPVRRRLLGLLVEPGSASTLAKELNEPRQKVNYHLKELLRVGLIRHVESRRKRNWDEQVFQVVAKQFSVAAAVFGQAGLLKEKIVDRRSLDYIASIGESIGADVAKVKRTAQAGMMLPTLVVEQELGFDSEADRFRFGKALADALERLMSEHCSPNASAEETFKLWFAIHPKAPSE